MTHPSPPLPSHSMAENRAFRQLLHPTVHEQQSNPLLIPPSKKKTFTLRGLGCASAEALSPDAAAAVRSSADWKGNRGSRRRKVKKIKKKDKKSSGCSGGGDVAEVWCTPGVVFGPEASVDCVVSQRQVVGRDRVHRQRSCGSRRGGNGERISTLVDDSYSIETPLFRSDRLPSGHLQYMPSYRRSPAEFEEMLMFQTRILLGMDGYDQHQDLRLDVDDMSYEELLELGDKIGYVSTGLREEEVFRNLQKMKHSYFNSSPLQKEWKCSICQEEYEVNDEMGRLECGHSYHINCIKQWLLRKNACPICKTAMTKS